MVTEPLSTSEQIANGIRQTAFQPNEAYANYTQARDDAQIQAALYRLQGNPEAAAKVEAQWETNFALNFAGGGSGALRKLPRSGADVWEAGPVAKGKLEADAPNLDPKQGHGGTSLAGLPEHYRESGGSVGASFNEAGELPDGYRRVLNTKTGNTEVVSSDGVFYFETASGLRPKAGGNLAGLVEAERRIAGPKATGSAGAEVPVVRVNTGNAVKGSPEFDLLNKSGARAANTRYELDNGNSFKTNSAGQVEELTFTPVNTKVPRDARQTEAGKQGRDTDVGGHAQACSQGGTCDGYNLFPQDRNFNNSAYKVFYEHEIKRAVNDPAKTVGPTTIKFNRSVPDSPRPDTLSVTYTIDGKTRTRIFENEANKIPKDQ